MKSVIYIDKNGDLKGLSDDLFDKLTNIGTKFVHRVSDIEFDHDQQVWVATDMSGAVIASSPIRSAVISAEREFLNKKIERQFAVQ